MVKYYYVLNLIFFFKNDKGFGFIAGRGVLGVSRIRGFILGCLLI